MPVRVTADQASEKWKNRLSAATAEITAGVNRVTVSPGQQAAAKADKWFQAVTDSREKWRRNTGRVSLDDWKNMMLNVGVQRIAAGATAKQSKMTAFMNEFIPHLEQGLQKVNAMPDNTFEERVQKAVEMMRHNRTFKRGAR